MGWGLESEMTFYVPYPKHDATAVYVLAKIARELGIDPGKYAPGSEALAWQTRSTDWDGLMTDMTGQIMRLKQREVAAIAAHDDVLKRLDEAEAARDEAQAEVRAMLEGRRDEEERARMRLLEKVFAAEMSSTGVPKTNLLPRVAALGKTQTLDTKDMRAALLADLDALVALGLRGEVLP